MTYSRTLAAEKNRTANRDQNCENKEVLRGRRLKNAGRGIDSDPGVFYCYLLHVQRNARRLLMLKFIMSVDGLFTLYGSY